MQINGPPIIKISTQQASGSSFIPNNTKKSNHNLILLVPLEDIDNPYFPFKIPQISHTPMVRHALVHCRYLI
jgi:hypothetical protein